MTSSRPARAWSAACAVAILAAACDVPLAPDDPGTRAGQDPAMALGRDNGGVTVPFKAAFFTDLVALMPDESCGAPPRLLNIQEGFGQSTHLGRFTVRITFCVDVTDILDGALTDGESLPYDSGEGTLIAANGDRLFITIAGAVLPSDHPDFDFEFADPFQFTGGTGRFAGAGGSGMTNSLVDFQAARTHHHWSGSLTLPRGN